MIPELRTAIYPVDDLAAAVNWYSRASGFDPCFGEALYVGLKVGGFELGLIPGGQPVLAPDQ